MMLAVSKSWVKKALPKWEPMKDMEGEIQEHRHMGRLGWLHPGVPKAQMPPQGPRGS